MRVLYSLGIYGYYFIIYIVSLWNKKANLWINGRKKQFKTLEILCQNKKIVWIHCASLGEYEQGEPLIKKIKRENPKFSILCTFFSPSGYEIKKNDPLIDIAAYLPLDSTYNAKKFITAVKPYAAIFVKYEYWYNFIQQLAKFHIPFYYISAIYRKNQLFFKWYGSWYRKQIKKCSYFYVQNENSQNLLNSINIKNVTVIGDTRFDQVFETAKNRFTSQIFNDFVSNKKTVVCGSTWLEDEKILATLYPSIQKNHKLIIAPHIIDNKHIKQIQKLFQPFTTIRYTEIKNEDLSNYNILIIDTIGLLKKIYHYGTYAYIGGGFRTGLHNVLEAAVYAIPLFFGPKYKKHREAIDLVNNKTAFSIRNAEEIKEKIFYWEKDVTEYENLCYQSRKYISENLGSVNKISISL